MQDPGQPCEPNFALLAAGAVTVIVYGSLFPFHFHGSHQAFGPVQNLIRTWRMPPGRGDFLANVLLYLPYGMFLAPLLRRSRASLRVLLVTSSGSALAVALELAQFYIPGRVSALPDVYANTVGSVLGAVSSATLLRGRLWLPTLELDRRPFVILLLSSWFGFRLFPFVPTIDLHKYWTAVKPLVFSPQLPPLDLYRHTVLWLAVAMLLEAVTGVARSRLAVLLLAAMVLSARVFVLDTALSAVEVAGAALAVFVWATLLSRLRNRAPVLAILFAGVVVIQALDPFRFSAPLRPFGWVPFLGFLRGSVEVNIRSFFEKTFTYGALVWLMARAGFKLSVAAGLGSGLVLGLRVTEVFLPERSPEITDVILVLISAAVMKLMGEDPARGPAGPTPLAEHTVANRTSSRHSLLLRWYESLIRQDVVQAADLIFVVAGRMERKHYGLELYRAGFAPRLVLSVGRFEVSKMREVDPGCADALIALRERTPADERHFFAHMDASGVHVGKIQLRRWSTYGEALAVRRFLEGTTVRKVMIVSTGIHLRRAALAYKTVFRGAPLELLYCAVPERFGFPARDRWWSRPGDRKFVVNETLKLAGYRAILAAPQWATPWLMRLKRG